MFLFLSFIVLPCGNISEEADFSRLKWIEGQTRRHQTYAKTSMILRILRNANIGDDTLYDGCVKKIKFVNRKLMIW